MKEAATYSGLSLAMSSRSRISLGRTTSREMLPEGMLQPFLSEINPPASTTQLSFSLSLLSTTSLIMPSLIKMVSPASRSFRIVSYLI